MVTLKSESTRSLVREILISKWNTGVSQFRRLLQVCLGRLMVRRRPCQIRPGVVIIEQVAWTRANSSRTQSDNLYVGNGTVSIEGSTLRSRKAKSDDHTRCTRIPNIQDERLLLAQWRQSAASRRRKLFARDARNNSLDLRNSSLDTPSRIFSNPEPLQTKGALSASVLVFASSEARADQAAHNTKRRT